MFTHCIPARICYASSNTNLEYKLKAAFIYNFIKFTQWPNTFHEKTSDNPLVICVAGQNRFDGAFEPLAQKKVASHKIMISYSSQVEDLLAIENCHVMFVDSGPHMSSFIDAVACNEILTIGDSMGFAEQGGCIELREHNGKMRFIINRSAVKRQGLHLSYQVYDLALEVVGDNHDKQ